MVISEERKETLLFIFKKSSIGLQTNLKISKNGIVEISSFGNFNNLFSVGNKIKINEFSYTITHIINPNRMTISPTPSPYELNYTGNLVIHKFNSTNSSKDGDYDKYEYSEYYYPSLTNEEEKFIVNKYMNKCISLPINGDILANLFNYFYYKNKEKLYILPTINKIFDLYDGRHNKTDILFFCFNLYTTSEYPLLEKKIACLYKNRNMSLINLMYIYETTYKYLQESNNSPEISKSKPIQFLNASIYYSSSIFGNLSYLVKISYMFNFTCIEDNEMASFKDLNNVIKFLKKRLNDEFKVFYNQHSLLKLKIIAYISNIYTSNDQMYRYFNLIEKYDDEIFRYSGNDTKLNSFKSRVELAKLSESDYKYHPLAYLHLKLRKNYKLYERNLIPIIGKYLLLV